ncbi:MAG: hypothetical protein AAB553_04175 [Patescibacteria group bacterium]
MNKINFLLSLVTLIAVIVIIERLLPATRMLVPPYDFIRLHYIIQTVIIFPLTIVVSFFIIKTITHNF